MGLLPLTPERVKRQFDEFEEDFNGAIRDSLRFPTISNRGLWRQRSSGRQDGDSRNAQDVDAKAEKSIRNRKEKRLPLDPASQPSLKGGSELSPRHLVGVVSCGGRGEAGQTGGVKDGMSKGPGAIQALLRSWF